MPYVRDLLFLFVGYTLLKRERISGHVVSGLVLVLFVLSPLYDIVNNYVAFALGERNDFHVIATAIGRPWTHATGLLFAVTAACVLWTVSASSAPAVS
jgi:hypothetical protein